MNQDSPTTTEITLDPFRTDGPAALDTHTEPRLKEAALHQLTIDYQDPGHHMLTLSGDNILEPPQTPATIYPPIPTAGHLAAAVVLYKVPEDIHPRWLEICPPKTIRLQFPQDMPFILPWLTTQHFRQAANLVVIFSIALATAIAPALDDDDDDSDDINPDRTAFAC